MGREPRARRTDSVFDFLYVDHRRIGLYLSQFSDYGSLTSLVHSNSVSDDVVLEGGVPGVISGEAKESRQTGIEKHYDTQWAQALNFLDEIQSRQMLKRDLEDATIGSLLLASGTLNLVSLRTFEKTFGILPASSPPDTRNRHARRAHQTRNASEPSEGNAGLKILGSLEQPIFMVLDMKVNRLWSTLAPDSLVGGSADLNMKHGLQLTGKWHVLGILDCEPGDGDATPQMLGRLMGDGDNEFNAAAIAMWREFRLIFGRPADCHGVTPLMIMREIA